MPATLLDLAARQHADLDALAALEQWAAVLLRLPATLPA